MRTVYVMYKLVFAAFRSSKILFGGYVITETENRPGGETPNFL